MITRKPLEASSAPLLEHMRLTSWQLLYYSFVHVYSVWTGEFTFRVKNNFCKRNNVMSSPLRFSLNGKQPSTWTISKDVSNFAQLILKHLFVPALQKCRRGFALCPHEMWLSNLPRHQLVNIQWCRCHNFVQGGNAQYLWAFLRRIMQILNGIILQRNQFLDSLMRLIVVRLGSATFL